MLLSDLTKPSSVLKLFLRYIAEIIIIFLGITISFGFDQWREERQKQKDLTELSQSLLTDLGALKAKLASDLDGSASWIRQLDSIRVQRTSNKFSEQQLNWFYKIVTGQTFFLFESHSPTYLSAANSNLYNELPDSIRNGIYKLYQVQLPYFQLMYDLQQQNITHFRQNIMVPADAYIYQHSSPLQPDWEKFAKEIQRPAYGNFVNELILIEQQVFKLNGEAAVVLDDLEKSLGGYLKLLKD